MVIQDLLDNVLINQRLVIIDLAKSASEAAHSMVKIKCGALLVCDSSKNDILVGIVSKEIWLSELSHKT